MAIKAATLAVEINADTRMAEKLAKGPLVPKIPALQLRIGIHMGCFRIDREKLGSNARIDRNYQKTISGYQCTNVPTWDQRVQFNDAVNEIFDRFQISATITSGPYRIRKGMEGTKEYYSEGDGLFARQDDLMPEAEAREYCRSDEREAKARKNRNAAARTKRAALKAAKALCGLAKT